MNAQEYVRVLRASLKDYPNDSLGYLRHRQQLRSKQMGIPGPQWLRDGSIPDDFENVYFNELVTKPLLGQESDCFPRCESRKASSS